MNRRNFIATSAMAGAAPLAAASALGKQADGEQQYLELRHYHARVGSGRGRLMEFLREAAIPAWQRMGIGPVGVFNVRYGQTSPSVYVLLPHPTIESVATANDRLADDAEFQKAGRDFLNTELSDPGYVRMEGSLMRAFSHMPQVEIPEATAGNENRIFELRIYESHSVPAARRKVEMFNEGGEIEIFRNTGLYPVFFGETLVGPNMPNLTYMLSFNDLAERDRHWQQFIDDPAWKKLAGDPYYKDTVSNISSIIMTPASFSQI